jgi:hypothetical protein
MALILFGRYPHTKSNVCGGIAIIGHMTPNVKKGRRLCIEPNVKNMSSEVYPWLYPIPLPSVWDILNRKLLGVGSHPSLGTDASIVVLLARQQQPASQASIQSSGSCLDFLYRCLLI